MTIDEKGRCCGRKPLRYTGAYSIGGPHRFCPRCDRSYHLTENYQIPNWAWAYQLSEDKTEEFVRRTKCLQELVGRPNGRWLTASRFLLATPRQNDIAILRALGEEVEG